ncbi:hypothetical protein [Chitinophaga sp. YIM B06452]|uniref:hypothetical protein n=1 Tax=Chitinophaga sp. YIM B06452 TaxID=3082158 RepID=UPI0031FF0052
MDRFSFDLPGRDYYPVRVRGLLFEDEQGCFFAHLPGLDLTGYGASRRDAKDCLEVVLRVYFTDMLLKGTLAEDMIRLGWIFQGEMIWPPQPDMAGFNDMLELMKDGSAVRGFMCTIDIPYSNARA